MDFVTGGIDNMTKTLRILLSAVLAAVMLAVCSFAAFAEGEPVVYYFVDCGDYVVDTVSEGDAFGEYNTVTDQFFGADPSTGKQWGVVDESYDEAASTQFGDSRVNTKWTWAYEYNEAASDVAKEQSNRYCRNMSENGLDRVITYKFELPEDGEYDVEVGFANPWGNSVPVDLYLNGSAAQEGIMASDTCGVGTGKASPVDGYITVEAKTDQATINMAYIIISKVPAPAAEAPADNTEADEAETAPAAEPEQTETAPEADEAAEVPSTGITLAVIPVVAALAAVAVSKKK